MKKLEHYSVQKVTGDGRCLFRALVKGMSLNKGVTLDPREERENADELRMAVKEVICDNENERFKYEEALIAITVDESLKRYCQRIGRPDFWGGESELLFFALGIEQKKDQDLNVPFPYKTPKRIVLILKCRCCQSCVASRSQYTYQNMSIQEADWGLVLFPLQNMELSSARVQEKGRNQGKW
ncbi:OVARIAN TUMOR DOMAIN-containing deubiquitinating enzyme 3 isoform X4 [Rhododendron vialii]|nr:OVARIAN TUMOR DOMAIN-containing deubiquitinating enzyme 3 isoform X4 [Rhododendron vialii]